MEKQRVLISFRVKLQQPGGKHQLPHNWTCTAPPARRTLRVLCSARHAPA